MRTIIIFLCLVSLCWGSSPRLRGNCVSEAIINAEEWRTTTGAVKIAVSNIREGVDHAQALGLDSDGYWKFLTRHHSDGILRRWTRHFDVEPYRYVDVKKFIEEQEKVE